VSEASLWALIALALAIVGVRRRSAAVVLLCAQSLVLGVAALHDADGSGALTAAGIVLLVRGLAFPAALWRLTRATREPRRVANEPFALGRLVVAVGAALAAVVIVPDLGVADHAAGRAAVALVVLGIVTVATRRPLVFQAIGLLVAENGVYLASLAVAGGLPAVIELGVVFDLLVLVSATVALGAQVHRRLGTGDTTRLETLRD
jgi:hydrogenase-4 component E